MKFPIGRWLAIAALAFTAYATALFFLQEGLIGRAWSLLLSPAGLLAALLCLASYGLRGLRWRAWMALQDRPLTLRQGLRYYLAGYAFTPTPGNLGEAARGMLLVHQPLPIGKSAAVFGAERLADLSCLLLLSLPAAWWLFPMASSGWRTALAVALGLCLIAIVLAVRVAGRSERLRPMVMQRLSWLHAAWICLAHRPAQWFPLTLAAWSLQGMAVWLLCDLALVSASPLQASASYALAMVGGALSMLPAGLGGTEALLLGQLLAQGADLGAAVLLTVLARLLTLWFAVALGLACLLYSVLWVKDMQFAPQSSPTNGTTEQTGSLPVLAAKSMNLPAWLLLTAAASLALRLWIANTLPITGDEAYFYWWGVFPAWGYYDHPPMVGWLIAAMRYLVGDNLFSIRLPIVMLPLVLGAVLYWALSALDRTRAAWAVLLFWLAPINWLNVLITTDTPLIFWSALSVAALLRAHARPTLDTRAMVLHGLAGLFIGCAFLSKYFAVVLGLAYLVYFAAFRRERWLGLVFLVFCSMPGALINLAWNVEHGWSNIMFNAINRNETAEVAWHKPMVYLGMMVYLATPVCAWLAWRHRVALFAAMRAHQLLACVAAVPLLFFLLLSIKKVIGLHWVLSFYPFLFALLAMALPKDKLRASAIGMAWFTALHALAVIGIGLSSPEDWKNSRIHPQIVRSIHTQAVIDKASAPSTVLMANAYTPASIYGYQMRQYMPVFGRGNFHARQDDLLVDFSIYQGKTIRVLHGNTPSLDDYRTYFDEVSVSSFTHAGAAFHVVQGRGFRYEAYKKSVLADIHKRYYKIPAWLPLSGNPFGQRLCGAVRCPD